MPDLKLADILKSRIKWEGHVTDMASCTPKYLFPLLQHYSNYIWGKKCTQIKILVIPVCLPAGGGHVTLFCPVRYRWTSPGRVCLLNKTVNLWNENVLNLHPSHLLFCWDICYVGEAKSLLRLKGRWGRTMEASWDKNAVMELPPQPW